MFDVSKCQGQKFINGKYQLPAECDGAPQGYEQTPVPVGKKPDKTPAPAKPKPPHKAQHADLGIFKVAQNAHEEGKDKGIDTGESIEETRKKEEKAKKYEYKGPSPAPFPGDPIDSPKKKPEPKKYLIG